MRTHGTLTKWNDDRGFGFITPAKGPPDVFVHISAFPRQGGRPQLNELISFEVEPGKDGKLRAVRVMRPAQRSAARPVPKHERAGSRAPRVRAGSGVLALIILAAIGFLAWSKLHREHPSVRAPETVQVERFAAPQLDAAAVEPPQEPPAPVPVPAPAPVPRFSCDGRTMCSQMTSCEEATYFLRNCPNTKMDGDGDGRACEDQFCGH